MNPHTDLARLEELMKTNLECLRKKIGLLPVLLTLFFLMGPAPVNAESPQKWEGYFELLGKPGSVRSLGQTDLFIPLSQDENDMTFFNQRSQLDDNNQSEHNFGIGHRHMFDKWIFGAYGYYDHRNTAFNNFFGQGTVGLEALSESFDVRVNGHMPDTREKDTGSAAVSVVGNQVSILAGSERALPGFDGEVGYKLPVLGFLEDTRLYLGGYHFNGGSVYEDVSGPRVRLEARVHDLPFLGAGSRLMLGVEAQHDDPRGTQTFGLLSVRIPFGVVGTKRRSPLKGLDRRMMQPVVRDVDIVTSGATRNVDALNPAGKKYEEVVYWKNKDAMEDYLDDLTSDETVLGVMVGDPNNPEWDMAGWRSGGENQVGGVSYVVAGKSTPIGYHNPITGSKRTIGFVPEGTAPTMTWGDREPSAADLGLTEPEKEALTDKALLEAIVKYNKDNDINISLFTMQAGDHINGWDMDAEGFINGLKIEGDSSGTPREEDEIDNYYITNTNIYNAIYNGIEVSGLDKRVNIWDSSLTDNGFKMLTLENGSGAVVAGGAQMFAHNVKFDKNAVGATATGLNSYLEITGDYIGSSSASYNAGMLGVGFGISAQADAKIVASNMLIEGNQFAGVIAGKSGNIHESTHIDIEDSIIRGNDALLFGGKGAVVAHEGATIDGYRLLITNNFNFGVASYGSDGGLGYVKTSVNIFDSIISHSNFSGVFAAEFLQSIIYVENTIFEGNGDGSGIAFSRINAAYNDQGQETSIIRIYNSTFLGYRGYDVDFRGVDLRTTFEGTGNKDGEGNDVPLVEFTPTP